MTANYAVDAVPRLQSLNLARLNPMLRAQRWDRLLIQPDRSPKL